MFGYLGFGGGFTQVPKYLVKNPKYSPGPLISVVFWTVYKRRLDDPVVVHQISVVFVRPFISVVFLLKRRLSVVPGSTVRGRTSNKRRFLGPFISVVF